MTAKKFYFVMLGVVGLIVVLAVGGIFVGNSMLQKKSAELVELKLQDRLIEEQQAALIQANNDIEKYQELETMAKTIVPRDKDQAKSVREIINIAEQSNITITSITFPTSTLGSAPPPTNTSSAGGATATPKTPAAPPLTQVKPVAGINGLFEMEISIQVGGNNPTYNQFIDFLSRLEQNRRTAHVTSLTLRPTPTNRNFVTFNIKMNVFVKP